MGDKFIEVPCLPVTQPIGTYFIGAMDSADLLAISYADVRRPEGRELERYIGTQRDLSEGRVSEIKKYVRNVDACFPTSVILALSSDDVTYNEAERSLQIRRDSSVAKIIDGQHRIAGLEGYAGPPFALNVTIFVDMDIEDQAMVFATINLKQTKVSKSLAYDLYEYAESRSPQKTCHNIAKLMNFKEGSPFYLRVKILGKSSGAETEVLTQATFVDRLLPMITSDAMLDRDRIKRGNDLQRASGRTADRLIFRDRFIEERDAEIAKVLWNYFKAVEARWFEGWSATREQGKILPKTTGFAALMRLLPEIVNDMGARDKIPSEDDFLSYLGRSRLESHDFTSARFKPGSTGESDLVKDLRADMFGI